MNRSALLARAGRLAALLGVAAALTATSVVNDCDEDPATEALECPPCQPQPDAASFAVSSSCGPSGTMEASFTGTCDDDLMDAPAGPSIGLPDGGLLEVPYGDWDREVAVQVIREGRFVLLGPVVLAGDVKVHRTCRLTPSATAGTFELACTGPEPEAACTGTLALVEPAP